MWCNYEDGNLKYCQTKAVCLLYLSFSLTISQRKKEEKPFNDDGLLFSLRGEKLNAYK